MEAVTASRWYCAVAYIVIHRLAALNAMRLKAIALIIAVVETLIFRVFSAAYWTMRKTC